MSIQESRQKLRRNGYVLFSVGGFKHDVWNKATGKKEKESLNPTEVASFATQVEFQRKINRLNEQALPRFIPVQAKPARRVFKVQRGAGA
jgi:hypothetical protein